MNKNQSLYKSIALIALTVGLLLMIPLIAMQFSNDVVWTLSDFVFAGTLLFGTGLSYRLMTRKSGLPIYRIAIGLALFTGLLLIWVNLAVGIIGSEDNPINLVYFGVIFIGILGAFMGRFRSRGMERTMFAMAITQAVITAITLIGGFYQSPPSTVFHIIGVNGFFITLYILSALLFRHAAKDNKSTSII